MRDVIEVVLLKRTQERGGGLLHPGETAAFSPDIAEDLVQRGVARWVSEPKEISSMKADTPAKAMIAPPVNRMLDDKRTKKK